jgi:predicted transposase/invertase (TIGR01784 family)
MNYINPTTDFAFKKIFGSDESHNILISFLNGIIYGGALVITDLVILDPYQAPRIEGFKSSYLDVKAKLSTGESVIIEMQVLNIDGFQKRILYNATKTYSAQLKSGDGYSVINPVIALTILGFSMFEESEGPIARFILKEKTMLFDYPVCDLELVFVELPKFKTDIQDLITLTDKWMYFLRNASKLGSIPDSLDEIPEIHEAFSLANEAQLTVEERDRLDREIFFIYDQQKLKDNSDEALIRANEALIKGLEQGLEQGRAEATSATQKDIARRLLDLMDDETIAQTTGLSVEEVRCLR